MDALEADALTRSIRTMQIYENVVVFEKGVVDLPHTDMTGRQSLAVLPSAPGDTVQLCDSDRDSAPSSSRRPARIGIKSVGNIHANRSSEAPRGRATIANHRLV